MPVPMLVGDVGGVVRLSTQAPTGDGVKPGEKPANSEVRGEGGFPQIQGGVGDAANSPDHNNNGRIDPNHVAELQKAAAAGDPEALSLLKELGIGAGVLGAGYAGYRLLKSMKGRNKSVPTEEAASPSNKAGTSLVPQQPEVTRLNEVEIPRTAGYLENPVKRLPAPPAQRVLPSPAPALEAAARAARRIP